jgi:hypothetical protein
MLWADFIHLPGKVAGNSNGKTGVQERRPVSAFDPQLRKNMFVIPFDSIVERKSTGDLVIR